MLTGSIETHHGALEAHAGVIKANLRFRDSPWSLEAQFGWRLIEEILGMVP
jgi:hypothetical protein